MMQHGAWRKVRVEWGRGVPLVGVKESREGGRERQIEKHRTGKSVKTRESDYRVRYWYWYRMEI
jgi:hypothetical protein